MIEVTSTKIVRDPLEGQHTIVTLSNGKTHRIQRLNATESMGLPGWHDLEGGFLGNTKQVAIDELVRAATKAEEAVETLAATSIATPPSERDGEAPEHLDEASTRDRDPADPDAVADELATWVAAQASDDQNERDEADASLDAVLLEQGVICPTDVIDWITWSDEFATIGLAGGEEIRISRTTGELAA